MCLYAKLERYTYSIKKVREKKNYHLAVECDGVAATRYKEITKEDLEKKLKALVDVLAMDRASKQAENQHEENREETK